MGLSRLGRHGCHLSVPDLQRKEGETRKTTDSDLHTHLAAKVNAITFNKIPLNKIYRSVGVCRTCIIYSLCLQIVDHMSQCFSSSWRCENLQ